MTTTPRTAAGRAWLMEPESHGEDCSADVGLVSIAYPYQCDCGLFKGILAIEAEVRALDVERLAQALLAVDDYSTMPWPDSETHAAAITAAYVRDGQEEA